MTTDDPKNLIRRPTVRVASTGQMALFEGPKQAAVRLKPSPATPKLKFNDPDPERLAFGDTSLRHYLIKAGLGFAIHTRTLFDELDFSAFEARYSPGGRPPYSPRRMVSLIVYAITQGSDSLRAIERIARRDLVALWLTGGVCPDHSTLGRFIQLHHLELRESLFEELTRSILGRLPEANMELSGDGTIVEAAASRFVRIKREVAEQRVEEAQKKSEAAPENPKHRQELEQAEACVEAIEKRQQARKKSRKGDPEKVSVNPHEPEAVIHKLKGGTFRFAYIASILANQQRIIFAQTLHQSDECAVMEEHVLQATRILSEVPERLCLDSGYFVGAIIKMACSYDLDLLCVPPEQSHSHRRRRKRRSTRFPKRAFQYDVDTDTYTCPAGQTLTPARPASERDPTKAAYYETRACLTCPFREQCTTSPRPRRIRREPNDEYFEAMREVMSQPGAQKAYQQRQVSVEPVFAELKGVQGLNRFRRRGLQGTSVEFALHAMAHNLRRMWVLLGLLKASLCPYFALSGLLNANWRAPSRVHSRVRPNFGLYRQRLTPSYLRSSC